MRQVFAIESTNQPEQKREKKIKKIYSHINVLIKESPINKSKEKRTDSICRQKIIYILNIQ